jgi:hypothetical protein
VYATAQRNPWRALAVATIIPETGAGVPYANSYVTLAYADAYFEVHPYYADAWAALPAAKRTVLLIGATQQIDLLFDWSGIQRTSTQGLAWPQHGATDSNGNYIPANLVPPRVQQAVCEQAFYMSKGDPTAITSSGAASEGISKIKIDVIELDFTDTSSSTSSSSGSKAAPNAVLALLRGLGVYANGFRVRKVLVG